MLSIHTIDGERELILFDYVPAIIAILNKNGEIIYQNKRATEFFSGELAIDRGLPFVNDDDQYYLLSSLGTENGPGWISKEIPIQNGVEIRWISFQQAPIKLKNDHDCHILTFSDITAYKNLDSLLSIKKQIIQMIVKGGLLPNVLNKLSLLVEEILHKQFHTGVMLLDEGREHLHFAASPTLPPAFIKHFNGFKCYPNAGSCGPAIYNKEMFISTDIAIDKNWEGIRDIALHHDIHSSWSFPIIIDNEPIGTFTMYHSKPYSPSDFEIEVLETCSFLIGLAVERDRSKKAVESYAEESLRTLIHSIEDIVIFKDRKGNWTEINHTIRNILNVGSNCLSDKNEDQLITLFPENQIFFQEIKKLTDTTQKTNQTSQTEMIIYDQGRNLTYDFKTAILKNKKGVLLIGRDITEKTRIKDELVITKMELENTLKLQKAITLKFVKSGNTFKVTMAKGEGLQQYGLDETKMLNRTLDEYYPPDKLAEKKSFLERAWAGEEILYEGEMNARFFIASMRPIYKNDQVTEIVLSVLDINRLKTMEHKLEESEKRYSSLVTNSLDAIYYQDRDGVILEANNVVEKITGYKVQEIVNRNFQQYVNKDYYEHTLFFFGQAIEGSPQRFETALTTKEGGTSYVSVTLIPVFENRSVKGLFGIAKDITPEKKILEELRNTKEKLESFIEHTSDSIIIMDLNGNIKRVNRAFERMFGWSRTEAEGQNIEIIQRDRHFEFQESVKSVYEGKSLSDWETVRYHKFGHPLEISLSVGPIRDKTGEVIAISSIMRDITDRKRTEDLLRKAEQLAMIGQLAAGVAHEIRNPLTSLNGFLQLINEMNEHNEYISVMRDELKRIEFITNEFLSLAKPHVKVFKQKNIESIIDGVVAIAEIQGVLKSVVITTQYETDLPAIECDENQLKRMFKKSVF